MTSSETYFNLVRDRNLGALAILLAKEPVDSPPALHARQRAIEHGYLDVVDVYFTAGLNVNVRGDALGTPLIWAAQAKHLKLVNRLARVPM